ncbi:MAG TPA: hypothetical protein VGP50_09280 [Stellaceae bacterium]|jgi:hypothetical protein|nr:hypothetical protein [Stellaceae bacterium]
MLSRPEGSLVSSERDVIFEFVQVGGVVKVTALDTASGIEASIVGDPSAGDAALKRLARKKLDYVLAKRGAQI